MATQRDSNGRFQKGTAPGPGRRPKKRRTVEVEYKAAVSECVTLADWHRIVERAKADALAGDSQARQWLAKILIGGSSPSLSDLAILELAGVSLDDDLEAAARGKYGDDSDDDGDDDGNDASGDDDQPQKDSPGHDPVPSSAPDWRALLNEKPSDEV